MTNAVFTLSDRRVDPSAMPGTPPGKGTTWQSVRTEILRRIKTRVYAPGELIPSEQEIAAEMGCARATVNRALAELARRGVLERRRRVGTRVSLRMGEGSRLTRPLLRSLVEAEGRAFGYRFLGGRAELTDESVRGHLLVPHPDDIRETEALFLGDGAVFCHERRWTNMALLPDMTDAVLETVPANEWLARHVPLSHGELRLTAQTAGQAGAAAAMGVDPAAPVLVYDFCSWTDSQPVTCVRHVFAPGTQVRNLLD